MTRKRTMDHANLEQHYLSTSSLMIWGDPDAWRTICKVSNVPERWMRSTKAMEISGFGVLVQVSSMQGDAVSEDLCPLPGVRIVDHLEAGKVVSRTLEAVSPPASLEADGRQAINEQTKIVAQLAEEIADPETDPDQDLAARQAEGAVF